MKNKILFLFIVFYVVLINQGISQKCQDDSLLLIKPIYQNGDYGGSLPVVYNHILTSKGDSNIQRLFIRLYKGIDNFDHSLFLKPHQLDSIRQVIFYGKSPFFHRKNSEIFKLFLKIETLENLVFVSEGVINNEGADDYSKRDKIMQLADDIRNSKVFSLTLFDNNIIYVPDFFKKSQISILDISFSKNAHYLPINLNASKNKCIIINHLNIISIIQGLIISSLEPNTTVYSDTSAQSNYYYPLIDRNCLSIPAKNLTKLELINGIHELKLNKNKNIITLSFNSNETIIANISIDAQQRLDGLSYFYYPSGTILQKRKYAKGKPIGIWETYDEFGNIISTVRHKYSIFGKHKIKIHTSLD